MRVRKCFGTYGNPCVIRHDDDPESGFVAATILRRGDHSDDVEEGNEYQCIRCELADHCYRNTTARNLSDLEMNISIIFEDLKKRGFIKDPFDKPSEED